MALWFIWFNKFSFYSTVINKSFNIICVMHKDYLSKRVKVLSCYLFSEILNYGRVSLNYIKIKIVQNYENTSNLYSKIYNLG